MLTHRVASAAILIPLVALVVYLGSWPLLLLILLVALLAGHEYLSMTRTLGLSPGALLFFPFVALLVADAYWPALDLVRIGSLVFVLSLLVVEIFHRNRPGSLHSWAVAVSGAIYIGHSLGYFVRLRGLEDGIAWVALTLLGTWISDTGAYFVGSAFGRRRLAQHISPNKSWEGVWGGLATGVLSVWLMGWLALRLPHWQSIVLGLVLVVAATLGDLAESVIKRQVGVKDSGNLIPGHGGMLDRVDSLLFVAPSVYYCAVLFAILD